MTIHPPPHGPRRSGLLAILFFLVCSPVLAGEPGPARRLPPGTVTRVGAPPFEPGDREPAARARWLDEARHLAIQARATEGGARHAADLWLSIGACLETEPRRRREALAAYLAARDAYEPGAPRQGLAATRLVALHLADGNAPAADMAFAWLTRWRGRLPLEAPAIEAQAAAALLERVVITQQVLAADVAVQHGRLREAAQAFEALAGDLTLAVDEERRARWWEEAARWRARAGDHDAALADIDDAQASTQDGGRQAHLALWRLHARFGALDARGDVGRLDPWPGPAFLEAAGEHITTWWAEPHAATHALTLGSAALRAGAVGDAGVLYGLALRDPRLLRASVHDDDVLEGLLVGVMTALRGGRRAEAAAALDTLERASGRTTRTMDDLRIALREDPDGAASDAMSGTAEDTEGDTREDAMPPRRPARITPAAVTGDRGDAGDTTGRPGAPPARGPEWGLAWLAAAAALALLLLERARRRRRPIR